MLLFSFLSFLFNSDPRVLEAYNYTDIILRLPGGKRIRDIKWLSVWCRRFTVSDCIDLDISYVLILHTILFY